MSHATNALQNILNKCQQYYNADYINTEEVHAVLGFIHREANVAMGKTLYPTCKWMEGDHKECGNGSTTTWCPEHREHVMAAARKAGEHKMALSLKGIVGMSQLRRMQAQLEVK